MKSWPVKTPITPGIDAAWLASIDLILAWAYGERSRAAWANPGSLTSSKYAPAPVIRRGSSRRLSGCPTIFVGAAATASTIRDLLSRDERRETRDESQGPPARNARVATRAEHGNRAGPFSCLSSLVSRLPGGTLHLLGGVLDGADDVLVAGAPAEVALQGVPDLGLGRV